MNCLDRVLARTRLAVLARSAGLDQTAFALPTIPELAHPILRRETAPAAPLVKVKSENPSPFFPAPAWPSLEAVIGAVVLSRGARRVFGVLHGLACDVAKARGYVARPDTVAMHLPASLLALGVGYSTRHLRRLLPELERAGLLACGAHASKVRDMSLWDGYLWSVKVSVGEVVPHLRREDWHHSWRDFAGDIDAGRTVQALLEQMSALHPDQRMNAVQDSLKQWSVAPGNLNSPVACSADILAGAGPEAAQDVRQVAYRLGELVNVPASKRAELVGRTASALARLLNDPQSRRWYCRMLWEALKAEQEGRGGLSTLSAALARLEADRAEWTELKNPAALLASRLRSVA